MELSQILQKGIKKKKKKKEHETIDNINRLFAKTQTQYLLHLNLHWNFRLLLMLNWETAILTSF
jgi:hypothetical protein